VPSASKANVAPTGPTMLAMPRSVCCAPMTNPNSCRGNTLADERGRRGKQERGPHRDERQEHDEDDDRALGGSSAAGSGIRASPRNKEIVPNCMVRISP